MSQTKIRGSIDPVALRTVIERIERIEAQKMAMSQDVKEILAEAKSSGFDVAAIRKVITLRKLDPQTREEQASTVSFYLDVAEDKIAMTPAE